MNTAPVYEVFSSVQGEATRVGERHVFVRLAGCDLECAFCDTPASRRLPKQARLLLPDGTEEVPNPLARATLFRWVVRLDEAAGPHHAVAITGGEPLLYAEYLRPLAESWREHGLPVLLETGGHRPAELECMLDAVDCVMTDVKIASSAGFATEFEAASRSVRLAAKKECAIKVVVSAQTTPGEIACVAEVVAHEAHDAPLILQPVTGSRFEPPSGDHLLALQRAAMSIHRPTRVIPQAHRALHVR